MDPQIASAPDIRAFFDPPTNTVSYLVSDPEARVAAVIDPVLDFDVARGVAEVRSADAILTAATELGFEIRLVLETHAHADHLSAAPYIKAKTGALIAIGEHIRTVQHIFRPIFGIEGEATGGGEFDLLFANGDRFEIGTLVVEVIHSPGHTPADVSYRIGDAVFVGDTLFMPDYGTARADFPGGDARQLFHSIRTLLELPRETRLFMCHDYKAPGRGDFRWETTVGEQRDHNIHIRDGIREDEFVALREARDATLDAPRLLLPAIQVNIRAGHFPSAEASGVRYLRIPVTLPPTIAI